MKVSNMKCYYCTKQTWEIAERLHIHRRGTWKGQHAEPCRYKKDKGISHTSRRLIKKGVFDDVDLTKNINILWITILSD